MLQASYIREHKSAVVEGLKKKWYSTAETDVDQVLLLDDRRKQIQAELDAILAQSNALAKSIGELMKSGKKQEAEESKVHTGVLKEKSKELQEQLSQTEQELYDVLVKLPNVPHASVPEGKTAEQNRVVYESGSIPTLAEDALAHWDIIRKADIIDFELGNKISGAGFPVYKGKGARLQRALINFFLDRAVEAGYIEVQPPLLINKESGFGTGQLPDKEGQMYHVTVDDLYLLPTAEVPITNIYRDVIVRKEDLPIRNVGYTPCFRREAGSWGAHVRGLNRLHQFDKVEIVQIVEPAVSYATLDQMVAHVRSLMQMLRLPYRILHLCGGDISFNSALTYDFEVWSGAQKRWLEVSSVSNFETFQANRLKLRYKAGDGKMHLLHTLNGSALALPRILSAILENYQDTHGVMVPEALVPYTGFERIDWK